MDTEEGEEGVSGVCSPTLPKEAVLSNRSQFRTEARTERLTTPSRIATQSSSAPYSANKAQPSSALFAGLRVDEPVSQSDSQSLHQRIAKEQSTHARRTSDHTLPSPHAHAECLT